LPRHAEQGDIAPWIGRPSGRAESAVPE